MLTHLLDTSIYSQRLRPNPLQSIVSRWSEVGDASLAISAICEAEIHYGLAKKNSQRLWTEYREYLENRIVLLPVDKSVSECFGNLKIQMEKIGQPRADFDLLISATAIVHNLQLVTLNHKHFQGIPDLKMDVWD